MSTSLCDSEPLDCYNVLLIFIGSWLHKPPLTFLSSTRSLFCNFCDIDTNIPLLISLWYVSRLAYYYIPNRDLPVLVSSIWLYLGMSLSNRSFQEHVHDGLYILKNTLTRYTLTKPCLTIASILNLGTYHYLMDLPSFNDILSGVLSVRPTNLYRWQPWPI